MAGIFVKSARSVSAGLWGSAATAASVWRPATLTRHLSAEAAPLPAADGEAREYDPKITQLADQIVGLTLLENADLVDCLKERLGVSEMAMMPMMGGGAIPAAGADGGAAAEEAAPAEEKTAFELKLKSFDAASKIKIIKLVRKIDPELGLVDAKKLVEGAPATLKADLPKDKAEGFAKELKDLGAEAVVE